MLTFSIITANYNSGEKLARTIDSIAQQRVDLEYLVMDGESTDGSLEKARALTAGLGCPVRIISQKDKGIYDAMNKGISLAEGRYLYFIGAGDTLMPGVLERVKPELPGHERGFVYGDVMWQGARYKGEFDRREICEHNISHQAIFHGRDLFTLCGTYTMEYRLWADWEFNLRCFGNRAVEKKHIDLVIAHFEDDGASSAGDVAFKRDRRRLIRRHLGLGMYAHRLWFRAKKRLVGS